MSELPRPLTLLIAALGGEGGGVLASWVVSAASKQGWPVQSTSIPGVAQRTGATTYYIETVPVAGADDAPPIMALTPFPGDVDVVVASELIEVGRAIQSGYVTPDRTTVIGSTHRIYAIQEKTAMADGRYDARKVTKAARQLSRHSVLFDMEAASEESGSHISAVMLGALAGSGALPVPRSAFPEVIEASGIAVASNLRGFELGYERAAQAADLPDELTGSTAGRAAPRESSRGIPLRERIENAYPPAVQDVVREGAARLVDYQGRRYAELFLDRLREVLKADGESGGQSRGWRLTAETARQLALRMSYEDVIRVADLKTRAARFERVRGEIRADPDQPVMISEYLKPGVEELCSVLPGALARPILRWARERGLEDRLNVGMRIKSTNVSGFALLWLLSKLRAWRPRSWRYGEEQAHIDRWLEYVRRAARLDYDFALEVVELAGLIKGYGSTHRRGRANFDTIVSRVVEPALSSDHPATEGLAKAREAALADPDGKALGEVLSTAAATAPETARPQAAAPSAAAR